MNKDGHEAVEVFSVTDFNLSGDGLQVSQSVLVEGVTKIGPVSVAHGRETSIAVNGKGARNKHEASLSFVGVTLANGRDVQGMIDWSSPAVGVVYGDNKGFGVYVSPSFIKGCR